MEQPINLETITDKDKLQSMAYEQVKVLEQARNNLQMIEARISQLDKPVVPEAEVMTPKE